MKFEIETNPYGNKKSIFRKKNIEINPGLAVLVGCNGSGKTTLLKQIERHLKRDDILYVKYDNLLNGNNNGMSQMLYNDDYGLFATAYCSSEGERIAINLGTFARKIGDAIKICKENNEKQLFVLLDGIDSGLSVDAIADIKEYLFKTLFEQAKEVDVYLIVSANDYTMTRNEQCLDVYTGNYKTFKDYEDYYKFIMKSRERKDKRYGNDN